MKNAKKIIAILLVVSLVSGIGIHQYGLRLSASEEDGVQVAEEQQEPAKEEPKQESDKDQGTTKANEAIAEDQDQGGAGEVAPEEQNGDGNAAAEEIVNPTDEGALEEQEEEVKMPAQNFKGSAGGITVVVSAPEGAFPEGTKMHVSAISGAAALGLVENEVEAAVDARGADISFTKDGKEIEPAKNISVKMAGAKVEGENFDIYHVADNGAVEKVSSNATSNGGSFKADEFSIYLIVGEIYDPSTAKRIPEGGTVTVAVGETIKLYIDDEPLPQLGCSKSQNGQIKFKQTGRYIEITGVEATSGGSSIKISEYNKSGSLSGKARFWVQVAGETPPEIPVTVQYVVNNGIGGTVTNDMDKIDAKTADGLNGSKAEPAPGYEFANWSKDGSQVTKTATLSADKARGKLNFDGEKYTDTTFVATFKYVGFTVIYDLNGGEKSDPAEDLEYNGLNIGDNTPRIKDPTKQGFEFNGWAPTVSDTVTGDKTVTTYVAQWAAKSTYKVEYYYKNNGAYTLDHFVTREGMAGENVSVTEADKTPKTGYYFDDENTGNVLSGTVTKDNALTLKLYFNQKDELTVTANSANKKYDGSPLTDSGYTYTEGVLPQGYKVNASIVGTITDVGNVANIVGACTITYNGKNVTDHYTINRENGTLTVTQRNVTLTSASDQKEFDGLPLTNNKVTVGGDGFANGEGATYNVTGSQTDVGDSNNTFGYTLQDNTKAGNYNISTVEGKLIVTEISGIVSVITTGGTFTYDGQPHGGTVQVLGLPDGFKVTVAKSDTEATHVNDGTVAVTCDELTILDKAGNPVEIEPRERVEEEVFEAAIKTSAAGVAPMKAVFYNDTVKIEPRTMTVVTDSATKTYDGTALKAKGHVNGLVKGEKVGFKTTGSRTTVGSSKNTYTLVWGSFINTQTAHKSDYVVKEKLGTLTVNAAVGPAPAPTPAGPLAAVQRMLGVDDGETPLANMDKDHNCCILHFLLMLASLIVLIGYTRSMKRRQEEIFELKKQIDERADRDM